MNSLRGILLAVLLTAGALVFIGGELLGQRDGGLSRWRSPLTRNETSGALLLVAVAASFSPAFRARSAPLLRRFHRPTPASARGLALAVALGATAYLTAAAFIDGRELVPRLHDEKSYVVQSRMMAHGMLWRAPHPLADSFETFFFYSDPVFGSKYFPGAMMLYVPGVWLGAPDWATSLLIGGFVVGMTCLVTTELLAGDGVAGIAASLLLLSATSIHDLGTWILSHEPAVLGSLAMTYGWLRWRATGRRGWAIALGAVAGWTAITRPIDVLAYALPLGVLILIDVIRGVPHQVFRRGAADVLVMLIAALPMLSVQLVFDKGVTGHWFETPYRKYMDRYQPGGAFGAIDKPQRPGTTLAQKIDYYDQYTTPRVQAYRAVGPWRMLWQVRIPIVMRHALGNPLMLILLPAGLLAGIWDRRLWFVAAVAPVFLAVYLLNPFMEWYYPIIIAPVLAILAVSGARVLLRLCPSRAAPMANIAVPLALLAIALGSIPELFGNFNADQATMSSPQVERLVSRFVHPQALVFFRYSSSAPRDYHAEPVYAMETGWPDDESIIRAQSLGPERDAKVVEYYARQQPHRAVFWMDRATGRWKYLGETGELTSKLNGPSAPQPANESKLYLDEPNSER